MASFLDEGSRRQFKQSDFTISGGIKNDNGYCTIKECILVDSHEDVVLKFVRAENVPVITISDQIPRHPNVLQILGTLSADGGYYTVSPKQDGDVLTWVKDQQRGKKEYADMAIQMSRGLNHLHLNSIIHRDVALRNFLFKLNGGTSVQICDFELGRILTVDQNDRVYSSPRKEQILWQHSPVEVLKHYGHSRGSDVYSFGISLWELFSGGGDPFKGRNPADVLSDLGKHFSAAQLLDLDGIPAKIILLIECCTQYLMHKRPTMTEVVEYLDGPYDPNGLPEYFTKVSNAKLTSQCLQYYAMTYEDLEFVEDEIRVRDGSLPAAAKKNDSDDGEYLSTFLKRLLYHPMDQQDVDNYIDMCTNMGLHTKQALKEYLSDTDSKGLVDDCFVIKFGQFRKLGRALFDDEERESVKLDEKMRIVIQAQKRNEMKKEVVRIEFEFPTSDRGKELIAGIAREAAKEIDIKLRVQSFEGGSIVMTLAMTSENLRRLQDQLNDNESTLRSPGNFFYTASIVGINDFSHGPTAPTDNIDDVFQFSEHGFPRDKAQEYARLLFDNGIYDWDGLEEFLDESDANAQLELIGISDRDAVERIRRMLSDKTALTDTRDEMTRLDDTKVQMDEAKENLHSMHEDIIGFGLEALKHLDSEMPRVFFVESGVSDPNLEEHFKHKTVHSWVIHFMCEGNGYFTNEKGYESANKPHITDHEGSSINLPTESLPKWLPLMRDALRVASAGVNHFGEIVEDISEEFELPYKLRTCDDRLKKLQELHKQDSVFQFGKDPQQAMDNCKLLHRFVLDKIDRDELKKGRCADLKLMWDKGKHTPIWVCEEHQKDLSELSDEDLRKLEKKSKISTSTQQQPPDESKQQTPPQQPEVESLSQTPNTKMVA